MKITIVDKNFEEGATYRKCSDANTFFQGMNALRDKMWSDPEMDSKTLIRMNNHIMTIVDEFYKN